MPSSSRDPGAPAPYRSRKVGVCVIVELGRGALTDGRGDDGLLAFDGTGVVS